jgi:hypothetical protein
MDIQIYSSVKDPNVEVYWRSYFSRKTVLHDYDLACVVEDAIYEYGTVDVSVVVFLEQDVVKGIFPISHEIHDDGRNFWTYYPSITFIAGQVTIDPSCWEYLPSVLPRPFLLQESSWKDYHNSFPAWVTSSPSNVVDISSSSLDNYLASLSKKHRSKLRNCLNRNDDIKVIVGEPANGEFANLKSLYHTHCLERYKDSNELCYFQYQMGIFPAIFEKAQELGQLVVLKFYLEDRLVAVNYSILDDDSVYDYICYRDPSLTSRSLGLFAILENIRYIQEHHPECKYYDLASGFEYKSKFLNCEKSHALFTLD